MYSGEFRTPDLALTFVSPSKLRWGKAKFRNRWCGRAASGDENRKRKQQKLLNEYVSLAAAKKSSHRVVINDSEKCDERVHGLLGSLFHEPVTATF